MPTEQRRFLGWMTAVAVGCVVAQAVTGVAELALYLTPLVLIVGLLLCGGYVGEDAIVRLRTSKRPPAARRVRSRWAAVRDRAFATVDRTPLCRRGPPAALLA